MNRYRPIYAFLFALLTLPSTRLCYAQTPAPASNTAFTLPLADRTQANALILPTQDGKAYLVYATPTGKIGFYLLTTTTIDPPQPPNVIPQKLTIAIVEHPATTTFQQRQVLSDPAWRSTAATTHNFLGIIPDDVKEKKTGLPPANLSPFLDRAKTHNLPWVMFTNAAGVIQWEGQLPTSSAELVALIKQYGG